MEVTKEEFTKCVNENYSYAKLMEHFGISNHYVRKYKREFGLMESNKGASGIFDTRKELFLAVENRKQLYPGLNVSDTANKMGVTPRQLERYIGETNSSAYGKDFGIYDNKEDLIDCIREYRLESLSSQEISDIIDISKGMVRYYIHIYEIPYNNPQPTVLLTDGGFTKEYFLDRLYIDSTTNLLCWKYNSANNLVKAGDVAGSYGHGRYEVRIGGRYFSCSHIVICMIDGKLPEKGIVIHKNEDNSDLSYSNLLFIPISDDSFAYHIRKRNQTPEDVNKKLMKAIWENCPNGWHVDHIVPLILGGLNEPDNLQYLTSLDNLSKGGKLEYTYKTPPIRWQDVINEEDYG